MATNVITFVNDRRIKNVVHEVLHEWHLKEKGWWYGYTKLMIDVKEKIGIQIELSRIKQALRLLHKEGKVKVEPIYKEDSGFLNGSGYFFLSM